MVSVIVPAYNVIDYIEQCIKSILSQSYFDVEIILVDDGSTDGSSRVCDDFAIKDSRIKVIHKDNEGLVRARKDGLRVASGEYVTYVDGDDWIEPDMIGSLVTLMDDYDTDMVFHGRFFDIGRSSTAGTQGFPEGYYDAERIKKDIFPGMIVNGGFMEWGLYPNVWAVLFRKSILYDPQMCVDDSLTMGEDAACLYPCIIQAKSIYITDRCFYHYRQNNASMVRNVGDASEERNVYRTLYRSLDAYFEQNTVPYDFREQWKDYLLFLMVPRADVLYDGFEKLDYLFPYPEIKKGSRVAIYCAGVYGMRLYKYLKTTGFCTVSGIYDQDYVNLSGNGIDVLSPGTITSTDADHVIIAMSFEKTRNAIAKDLSCRIGSDKVSVMDVELVQSINTWKSFGMI